MAGHKTGLECHVLLAVLLLLLTSLLLQAAAQAGMPGCVEREEDCEGAPLGLYPHCANCSQFLVCGGIGNVFALFTCPDGREFDVTSGVCNVTGAGVCGTTTTPSPTSPTSPTSPNPPNFANGCLAPAVLAYWCLLPANAPGNFSVCGSTCSHYLQCQAQLGSSVFRICDGDEDYDEALGVCVPDGASSTCRDAAAASPVPPVSLASPSAALAPVFANGCVTLVAALVWCLLERNVPGNFSVCSPSSCGSFLRCGPLPGQAFFSTCPDGEDFDETLGLCVPDDASSTCVDVVAVAASATSAMSSTDPSTPSYVNGCVSVSVVGVWCLTPANVPGAVSVCDSTCAAYLRCGPGLGVSDHLFCPGEEDFDESLGVCVADGASTTCSDP